MGNDNPSERLILKDLSGVDRRMGELKRPDTDPLEDAKEWCQWAAILPVPILVCDDRGTTLFANPPFVELFGDPTNGEPAREAFRSMISFEQTATEVFRSSGLPDGVTFPHEAGSKDKDPLETKVVCKDGSMRHVTCKRVTFSNKNLFVVNDMTDAIRAAEELSKANEKLKTWIYDLEIHNRKLNLLRQLGGLLQLCHHTKDTCSAIRQFGPQLFPHTTAVLFHLHESENILHKLLSWGTPIKGCHALTIDTCQAFRDGKLFSGALFNSECPCRQDSPPLSRDHLCIPMIAAGKPQGVLHIIHQENNESDRGTREFALVVSEQLSLAIANMKLQEELRTQAIRDPLTGLFNRRYMEESLEREFHRSNRQNHPVSIIMLDIDHFKRINDTFGHDAGDAILRTLGDAIQRNIRKEDIACRFGGEEFVLILPDTPIEVAAKRAEVFRKGMASSSFVHDGYPIGPVTVSLGIAACPEHSSQADAVLHMADEALYLAKDNGRNRIEIAPFKNS